MRSIPLSIVGAAIALVGCAAHEPAQPASSPQRAPRAAPAAQIEAAPAAVAPAPDAQEAPAPAPAAPNALVFEMLIPAPPLVRRPACDFYTVLTPRGIAIEFNSGTQPMKELRTQVHAIASRFNSGRVTAAERHQLLDDAATFGFRSILALHPIVTVSDTDDGARLQINAESAADVVALRAHVLWHSADFLPGVMNLLASCPAIPGEPTEAPIAAAEGR